MMIVDSSRFTVASGVAPSYVGSSASANSTATTFGLPAGAAVGDWAVVVLGNYFPSSFGISGGAGGWTYLNTSHCYIAHKVLEAADIGATFTFATNTTFKAVNCAVYSGVAAVTLQGSSQVLSATPASVAGFTPAALGRVVTIAKVDSDYPEPAITAPSGFTKRSDVNYASGVSTCVADTAAYGGGALAWAFSGTAVDRNVEFVFELT